MSDSMDKELLPPYIPLKTFLNLLDRLHQSGIPNRIDRTYWGAFLSGSTGPSVITALRFLDLLTSDNRPTDTLESLVAQPQDRKRLLASIIRSRYSAIFENVGDLSRATHGQLEKSFHTVYKVEGQTRRKSLTFFVHAAKYAEIPISALITSRTPLRTTSPRTNGTGSSRKPSSNGTSASVSKDTGQTIAPHVNKQSIQTGDVKTITLRSGGELTLSVSVKWLDLPKDDRNFVFELTDRLTEYEEQAKVGKADEKEDEALVAASSSS